MIGELNFDSSRHRFETTDGRPVPSVTQILKAVGAVDDRWFSEKARIRGDYVHRICAMHDAGRLDEKSIDDDLRGYYEAYLRFLDDNKPFVYGAEMIVSNKEDWYAGIVDRVFDIGGVDVLADIKTGSPAGWHKLQIRGYACCLNSTAGAMLALKENGKYQFRRVRIHEQELVNDWRAVLRVYWLCRTKGKSWG